MKLKASSSTAGADLRQARERLCLSRAQLAGLADCSFSQLSLIEQGAAPKRSRVLAKAWAAIDAASRAAADAATDQVAA